MHPVRLHFPLPVHLTLPINGLMGLRVCFYCRLRAELAASITREAALRELLGPIEARAPVPTEKDVFGGDENDGEPMDLATPLQPTVLLNPEDL